MGELRYAILGLLNHEPLTGYDITKRFKENISHFWDANHSQIYLELKNLLNNNEVEYEIVIQGEKLEKKLYHITELGSKELKEWLKSDGEPITIPKETFRLKLYSSTVLNKTEKQYLFNLQKEKHLKLLNELEKKIEHFPTIPVRNSLDFYDYLLIRGAIFREKSAISWLDECTTLLDLESK